MTYKTLLVRVLSVSLLTLSAGAYAYEPSWEGNHPDARSEAWTWMGHLREVNGSTLSNKGLGFIYYYTRNDTRGATGSMGQMNFRSSAVTETKDGQGQAYKTSTVYNALYPDAELRARAGRLDLAFNVPSHHIDDKVQEVAMQAKDYDVLAATMKLFPGLKAAPNFTPRKTSFHLREDDGTVTDLTFYSIWPALSAPEGKMTFLGQEGTYSFSDPMMVTVGTYGGKKVAGLSFLDRQWSKEYYGTYMYDKLSDLLRYAEAMNYAHSWSAFHARNQRTGEYTFFHLWNQWHRQSGQRDQKVDYSGMLYARGGVEYGAVAASDYSWTPSGFVQFDSSRKLLMAYAFGRYGFFPAKATIASAKQGLSLELWASPHSQMLNQPIYFYEGYAEGQGTWRGDKYTMQGRLESSRLFFRDQDYAEMAEILAKEKGLWKQPELATWIAQRNDQEGSGSLFEQLHGKMLMLTAQLSEMGLKLAIFQDILNGAKPEVDAQDPAVSIYK